MASEPTQLDRDRARIAWNELHHLRLFSLFARLALGQVACEQLEYRRSALVFEEWSVWWNEREGATGGLRVEVG